MSKDRFFGTTLDGIWKSNTLRVPKIKVYIWNKNRTTINDIVMGRAQSPKYDVTPWVISTNQKDTITFENNEDSVISNVQISLQYDQEAIPIPITEDTLLAGTPLQILQGDGRVPEEEWVPIFLGIIQGNPEVNEESRNIETVKEMKIVAADRASQFINTVITAFSYEKDEDIGKAVIETGIEFMGLERREIKIGNQNFSLGHESNQLVDIEALKGIAQMLFTVGKKPKFDSDGFLIAADADFDKAPARVYKTKELVSAIIRRQVTSPTNNSVRLLGLSNTLTEVISPRQRLANGSITSGFFESEVSQVLSFGTDRNKSQKARDFSLTFEVGKLAGVFEFGQDVTFNPDFEADGITARGGEIIFDTGSVPEFKATLIAVWVAASFATLSAVVDLAIEPFSGSALTITFWTAEIAAMVVLLEAMSTLGRVEWQLFGKPVEYVFQQIAASAQLDVPTAEVREIQLRNDWLYDEDDLEARAKELLRREIAKGWLYAIELIDDPLLDVDDVIEIGTTRYYITTIRRKFSRLGTPPATMQAEAWKIKE